MRSTTPVAEEVGPWELLAPAAEARDLARHARAQFAAWDGPSQLRRTLDGASLASPWPAVVDGGYTEIGVPEERGGLGTLLDVAVLLEEAGRTLLAAPLTAFHAASQTQERAGLDMTVPAQARIGIGSAEGRWQSGRMITERIPVLDGQDANLLLLVTVDGDDIRVSCVEASAPGVDVIDPGTSIDPTRPLPTVRVEAPPLDTRRFPRTDLSWLLAPARTCVAADLTGIAAATLDAAVDHAKQREQFGRPIGGFQAVQHQLVDAYIAVEKSRSLTLGAAWTSATGADGTSMAQTAAMAKATATEAALRAARLSVRLLGAMGITHESDAHLFLRRATQTAPVLGVPAELYAEVASGRMRGAS